MPDLDNRRPPKHPLDYVDVVAKLLLSAAAALAACLGLFWNRDANDRSRELVQRQTDNQIRSVQLQEAASQRQVAVSMMPYLTCTNPLSAMAIQVIHSSAPMFEADARGSLLDCAKTAPEKAVAIKLKQDAQQRALQITFFQHLRNARQYLHVNSYEDAAREYLAAYQSLPPEYSSFLDRNTADRAKQAFSNEDFQGTAQFFASAFAKVPMPNTDVSSQ